ncbi:RNA binding (RRM/RBD/RNP motifs) family protein isoform X2 [Wolffia australiana]
MDNGDDARTFQVDFPAEGFARLRDTVKNKLQEFLGDYTDDTLAEYVIVLLRNGRRKEEAQKELSVFLEDDSIPFVSWLWDHLSSNMHLYLPPSEESMDWENDPSPRLDEEEKKSDQKVENISGISKTDLENGQKGSIRESSNRRRRDWRGVARDEMNSFSLSTSVENASKERTLCHRSPKRRSRSPRNEKRRRQDELHEVKDMSAKPVLAVPSRLLQFAMRDAVKTSQQLSPRCENVLTSDLGSRRLRSVVSTSPTSTTDELHPKKRPTLSSVVIATAVRAAAEAATEVSRPRPARNVFSRLGSVVDHIAPRYSNHKLASDSDRRDEFGWDGHEEELTGVKEISKSASSLDNEDGMFESIDDSSIKGFLVKQRREESTVDTSKKDQEALGIGGLSTINKISNTSVLVDARTLLSRRLPKEQTVDTQREQIEAVHENLVGRLPAGSSNFSKTIEESNSAEGQKSVQRPPMPATGSYSTTRPSEDADSRTIFVSNVHFGATKDSLSRHFNKFGEVLKVIIITDAATRQPTGSAYVEFLRNESAELALSANGTSFMSRILKVVMRSSSAHQEAAALSPWSQGSVWAQQSYPGRGGRYSFSRGAVAGPYRGRLAIKPGARSLQWKRDSPSPSSSSPAANPSKTLLTPTGRSLTYVRNKPDAASA